MSSTRTVRASGKLVSVARRRSSACAGVPSKRSGGAPSNELTQLLDRLQVSVSDGDALEALGEVLAQAPSSSAKASGATRQKDVTNIG